MKKIEDSYAGRWGDRDPPTLYHDHGGDLTSARRLFPGAPEPFIDLSTGINPNAYPLPALPPAIFARLPDSAQVAALEGAAGRCYGGAAGAEVIAVPGTQAVIQLLPRLARTGTLGIYGFTYGEYRHIWQAAGRIVKIVEDLDALAACDLAVVVNPNNPDGRIVPAADLVALAARMAEKGGLLVVDEAFMDLLPRGHSLVPVLPEAALVLRSFGKTFGLAGVRLGFAISRPRLAAQIRGLLGPWAVSGPAIEIGAAAFADSAWLESMPQRLARQAASVDQALRQCGAERLGGTPLFQLFTHPHAEALYLGFGRNGVLLRRFPERPKWLRVGLAPEIWEERFTAIAARLAAASPAAIF